MEEACKGFESGLEVLVKNLTAREVKHKRYRKTKTKNSRRNSSRNKKQQSHSNIQRVPAAEDHDEEEKVQAVNCNDEQKVEMTVKENENIQEFANNQDQGVPCKGSAEEKSKLNSGHDSPLVHEKEGMLHEALDTSEDKNTEEFHLTTTVADLP